jgi:hypothetical protein
MWLVMTLNLFDALRLLSDADTYRALETGRLQALVMLHLSMRFDYYYVGLLFGAWHPLSAATFGSSPAIFPGR